MLNDIHTYSRSSSIDGDNINGHGTHTPLQFFLPPEMVEIILQYLSHGDQVAFASSCKAFYAVYCSSLFLQKNKRVKFISLNVNEMWMKQGIIPYAVRFMELIDMSFVSSSLFTRLIEDSAFQYVEDLHISNCFLRKHDLCKLLTKCTNIRSLSFSNMDSLFNSTARRLFSPLDVDLLKSALHGVTSLKLSHLTYLTDGLFYQLTDAMPSLSSLHLCNVRIEHSTNVNQQFTFAGLLRWVIVNARVIKELKIEVDGEYIGEGAMQMILCSNNLSLEKLELSNIVDSQLDSVAGQTDLKSLKLSLRASSPLIPDLISFTDTLQELHIENAVLDFGKFRQIGRMNNLRRLSLVSINTDIALDIACMTPILVELESLLPKLKHLSLTGLCKWQSSDILSICSNLDRVESLRLGNLADDAVTLPWDTFLNLSAVIPHLQHLELQGMFITPAADTYRLEAPGLLAKLVSLDLFNSEVTDSMMLSLPKITCLRSLKVKCSNSCTRSGFTHLAKQLPSLENLHLANLALLGDDYDCRNTLAVMVSYVPRLKELFLLGDCGTLDEDMVNWIVSCCPSLHIVDISGCNYNHLAKNLMKSKLYKVLF